MDSQIQHALDFLVAASTEMAPGFVRKKFPSLITSRMGLTQVGKNPYARQTGFRKMEIRSQSVPLSQKGNTGSNSSETFDQEFIRVLGVKNSASWSIEELMETKGSSLGYDIIQERLNAMREVLAHDLDRIWLVGDPRFGYSHGLYNHPNVEKTEFSSNIFELCDSGDFEAVKNMFLSAHRRSRKATLGAYVPNTCHLPPDVEEALNSSYTKLNKSASTMTFKEGLEKSLSESGINMKFDQSYRLEGLGSDGKDIICMYPDNKEIIKLHLTMPTQLMAPGTADNQDFTQVGKFRTPGTEIRETRSVQLIELNGTRSAQ